MFSKKSKRTSSSLQMAFSTPTDNNNNNNNRPATNFLILNATQDVPRDITKNDFMKLPDAYRNNQKSMIWGEPTWTFLHTLAHKVREEQFTIVRSELLKLVYLICTTLPCPECSQHSKTYLNNINFNTINSKSDFKRMLFEFHNSVNNRKGYTIFNMIDLDNTYQYQVLNTTFYNFIIRFRDRGASNRYIHEDIYRNQIIKDLVVWVKTNAEYFME